ncbi:MAG: glycosyltransferase [Acidobacteriota bacterium]
MRLLFLSTPVGPIGSGAGGGVELTLTNIAREMVARGHEVDIVAPSGSRAAGLRIIEVHGSHQVPMQTMPRDSRLVVSAGSALAQVWDHARALHAGYDLLVNFAYDLLPFQLTPILSRPVAHLVSMCSLNDLMDRAIQDVATRFPGTVAVHTLAQARTYRFPQLLRCVSNGLDLSIYDLCLQPDDCLGWAGRIAPEKGLDHAIAAARLAGSSIRILGAISDSAYWEEICRQYPGTDTCHEGFLPTRQFQARIGKCRALIMTPRWDEAFGNVAMESLACGVPVVAYRRGGLVEIVRDRETGFLVPPDDVDDLVRAIGHIGQIDRAACRRQAEAEFSMRSMGDRIETWLQDILGACDHA